jgi:hypothetical protein
MAFYPLMILPPELRAQGKLTQVRVGGKMLGLARVIMAAKGK